MNKSKEKSIDISIKESVRRLVIKVENPCRNNLTFDESLYGVGIRLFPMLFGFKPTHMTIEYDGGVIEDDFYFGAVSNTTSVAGVFALFQAAMPLIGWICVHTIVQYFSWFEKLFVDLYKFSVFDKKQHFSQNLLTVGLSVI